jgi:23S rRNA pseudouridine1911/1915/1917 synthase
LVCGHLAEEQGRIDLPIGRSNRDRTKMSVEGIGGREAITEYRVTERFRSYDLLEVVLLTGRTHQIRVHFSHLGHPVFGDPEYGGRERWHRGVFGPERPLAKRLLAMLNRQALHAARLDFEYPLDGEPMSGRSMNFEAPLPEDFRKLLEVLRKEGS